MCKRYLNLTEEEKTEEETRVVTEHKEMKQSCQKQKKDDKMRSYGDGSFIAATFDLQSVL